MPQTCEKSLRRPFEGCYDGSHMSIRLLRSSRQPLPAACLLLFILCFAHSAQAQLRVVTYNIAQLLGDEAALEDVIASLMADDKPGFATPVSVFIFQEVRTMDVSVLGNIVNAAAPPGVLYAQGTYTNIGENGVGGAQAMFYRAGMLLEDATQHQDIFTGASRYTDRWRLRLLGYDSPAASFYIYSSHLRASQGSANQQERFEGVQAIRANADALPAGTHIIYGGDMNFYNNLEPGYLHFLTPGNGQAIDPLGTGPWSGPGNAIKHSQSPRKIMAGGLIGGGMNQRFDFQLSTAPFHSGHGLSIIPGTYRSFGNDGLRFNEAINLGNNFYYPDNVPLSNFIADSLHDASDHIPVVVDYQVPARMNAAIMPANFGRVIQGANHSVNFFVQNSAQFVTTPWGADVLTFSAIGSGGIGGQAFGEAFATEAPTTGSLPVNTMNVGPVSGSVTFASPSEAVQPPQVVRNASGTIIRPSAASFSSGMLQQELAATIEVDADTGIHNVPVQVFNYQFDSLQALLNVDAVDGLAAPFSYVSGLAQGIGASPTTLVFAFDSGGLADGKYVADLVVQTSDENLPGATQSQIDLTITAFVGDAQPCVADLNSDGFVDVSDLLLLFANWGSCPRSATCPGDLNGDGSVDVSDLLILLGAWGFCP